MLLSRTYHNISQQSGRRFRFEHCSDPDKSSLRYSVIRGRDPPGAHAQARRVPAIASPRILRPIYTHTPATGFPYPRPRGIAVSRIGGSRGSRSRPVLAPASCEHLYPMAQWVSHLPEGGFRDANRASSIHSSGCRGRVSLSNTAALDHLLERTGTANASTNPIEYRDRPRARVHRYRVCIAEVQHRVHYYYPSG